MFKFKNVQSGFSIVQVLIAVAMAGGLALTIAKLGQEQSKISKTSSNNLDLSEVSNRVLRYMSKTETCTATLGNLPILAGQTKPIIEIKNKEGAILISSQENNPKNKIGGLKLKKIELIRGTGNLDDVLEFVVYLQKVNTTTSYGQDEIKKTFELSAKFDSDSKIVKCFTAMDGAVEAACESLGGALVNSDCVFNNNGRSVPIYQKKDAIVWRSGANCKDDKSFCVGHEVELDRSCRDDGNNCGSNKWRACRSKCSLSGGGELTTIPSNEIADAIFKNKDNCGSPNDCVSAATGGAGCPSGYQAQGCISGPTGSNCGLKRWFNSSVMCVKYDSTSSELGRLIKNP
jgi:hypothetical protein